MTAEQPIEDVMAAIGPAMNLGEVRAYAALSAWALVLDEDRIVFAELDRDEGRLWLSSEIAPLPQAGRLELLERLMTFNGQWHEAGGYRLALDDTQANLLLACDLRAEGLRVEWLQTAMTNFLGALAAWQGIVAAKGQGAQSPLPSGAVIRA